MTKEHDLIQPGISRPGGIWADIGSGTGIFTLELRQIIGPQAEMYSVERDGHALDKQRRAVAARYPDAPIHYLQADFTRPLALPPLDGIVMANALHFVPFERQQAVLAALCTHLKPDGGRFLIVEYDAQHGNPWVPYPVNYDAFENLAVGAGLRDVRRLAAVPSRFLREMYSAMGERFI